jgi:hypothetical protein
MKIRVIRDAQGQVVATVNQASEELGILVEPELGLDTQTEDWIYPPVNCSTWTPFIIVTAGVPVAGRS